MDRLICKHFNLSYLEIDELYLDDYYCLLAESLDAEEYSDYNYAALTSIAFNNPKYLKKWKWQSIDKAGTVNVRRQDELLDTMKNMGTSLFKTNIEGMKRNPTKGIDYAHATGRKVILRNPDGFLFDENATLLKDFDPLNSVIIHIDFDGNYI